MPGKRRKTGYAAVVVDDGGRERSPVIDQAKGDCIAAAGPGASARVSAACVEPGLFLVMPDRGGIDPPGGSL